MQMLKIHAEASERHHLGLRTQVDMKKARNSPCLLKVLWKQFVPVSPLPALSPPPPRLFLVCSAWSRTKLKLFCSFCYQRWQELQNNILSFFIVFKDVSFLTFELACTGSCVAEFSLNHTQCF